MSGAIYRVTMAVRWSDLDALDHVNNARFATFVEEARLTWLNSLSEPWITAEASPMLAALEQNFRLPVRWPATLAVELRARKIGNSSLTLAHRIVSASDAETLYSDGTSVMVWINPSTSRPTPLPDFLRRAAEALSA